MPVFYGTENLPPFKKAVITIGTFDGVHMGHKAILREVVRHAQEIGGQSVLLTFEPHPRKVLFPDQPLGIITPLQKKLQLIADAGIDHIVVVPFTLEFAALSAVEYIEHFLVGKFHPHSIVIGYDHHFGHDRAGNMKLLERYAPQYGFQLVEIPPKLIDHAAVSSTKVRHAIANGQVTEAYHMLGWHPSFTGIVLHGNKLGRTIGYPTANLRPVEAEQIIPGIGVYAVMITYAGRTYGGMMSIGYNPTVTDTRDVKLEVNIFDFAQDIYDETLEVIFLEKLRDEERFASLDALTDQLHADKKAALAVIARSH